MRTVSVELLPAKARSAVSVEWQRLETQVQDARLATSWIWTETWLDHYVDVVPHWFAVGERDGNVCGVALLTSSWDGSPPLRIRVLRVGTAGEPAGEGVYVVSNGFLSRAADKRAFAAALVDANLQRGGWGRLICDRLAPD